MFLLAVTCEKYDIEVHAYCLMGNHFHLVVYCRTPVLSSAMRDLKSRYAVYFNKRYTGTGGVFEGPFVEVPILSDEQLMREIRYAHRNPFDLDPDACLATYRWSSHGIYLGLRPTPKFMCTLVGHDLFGPDYRELVERPLPTDKVQNRRQTIVAAPGGATIGHAQDRSLATIRREVAHAAGCEIADVRTRSKNGLMGVAVLIAADVGFSASEIAEPFGFTSAGAVRMAASRARRRLAAAADLRSVYDQVAVRLRRAA